MTDQALAPEATAQPPPLEQTAAPLPAHLTNEDAYYDWLFAKEEGQADQAAAVDSRLIAHDQALRGEGE